jgi:phosphate/sulfate permease
MAGAVYGASTFLKLVVSTLLELVPIVGWFIGKPAVAFVFAFILGTVANSYFRDHMRLSHA